MRNLRTLAVVGAASVIAAVMAPAVRAQSPAHDPSARLQQVLPADVATHVLAVIAAARSHGLPAAALENRALKFAARGVAPKDIDRSVTEQAERMGEARDTMQHARGKKPSDDEVEAGAEAMRHGVDGAKLSALAKSAPSGRSLAVPLFVIGSLVDRGLPSDSALTRVLARLQARATDTDIERMPGDLPTQANGNGVANGQGNGAQNRPANAGQGSAANGGNRQSPPATSPPSVAPPAGRPVAGPPAGVPANGGSTTRPTPPAKGTVPGTKKP